MALTREQYAQIQASAGEPAKALAKRLKLTPSQVKNARTKLGLRVRPTMAERAKVVAEIVANREGVSDAARRLGLHRFTVAKWMADAGYVRAWVRKEGA